MKENSEQEGSRSRVDQYSLMDDQNYLFKKMAAANTMQANNRKAGTGFKAQSRILSTGTLLNVKELAPNFSHIKSEKEKKIHMKNKELLYKSSSLEVGYMGHLEGNSYKITIFISPEQEIYVEKVQILNDGNLHIETDLNEGFTI